MTQYNLQLRDLHYVMAGVLTFTLFLNGRRDFFKSFFTEFPKPVVIRLLADSVLIHTVLGCATVRSGLTLSDDFHPAVAPNDFRALIHDVLPL